MSDTPSRFEVELSRRMSGPQRHRLLQGYPMVRRMQFVLPQTSLSPPFDHRRPLLIGVLPHPFCNPRVTGCGFCTFPHEAYRTDQARAVTEVVAAEVGHVVARYPGLARRRVRGVYFGGGTANLTPPDAFASLCEALGDAFDLGGAEVTLEGAPVYFLAREGALLDLLAHGIAGRHRRISMGVQTFDPARLEQMGRGSFGTPAQIARVIATAQRLGMTTSVDLLYDLPGQTLAEMLSDVGKASAMGADQICLYHLVLFPGLGTPWSKDPELLAALPTNAEGCQNFHALRERLLALGYAQTTLTNFERREHGGSPRSFSYERDSFHPETFDAVGFGPGAISCFSDMTGGRALKWINASSSAQYTSAVARHRSAVARLFAYRPADLRRLFLTRKLSLLHIPEAPYRALFGQGPEAHFPAEFSALLGAGLLERDADGFALTVRGMFHADSVAGLLAPLPDDGVVERDGPHHDPMG